MIETIRMEEKYFFAKLGEETITGMTFRNAGNFFPRTNEMAFQFSRKVLEITNYYYLKNRILIMRSKDAKMEVIFMKEPTIKTQQLFHEAIIYRGKGAAVFFPGGCPGIIFHDEKANLSGLFHGGWRQVANGIIDRFLEIWERTNGSRAWTKIKILPGICEKCLNFDKQYYANFIEPVIKHLLIQESEHQFIKNNKERIGMNLIGLIEFHLKQKGYVQIRKSHECTCCSGKYWCYRCDDKDGKKYRNAAFIITTPFAINEIPRQFVW